MKDTILPLDMIFIRANGAVDSVTRDQPPFGLANTFSAGPLIAALEMSAGTADRLGLKAGDKVSGLGHRLPPCDLNRRPECKALWTLGSAMSSPSSHQALTPIRPTKAPLTWKLCGRRAAFNLFRIWLLQCGGGSAFHVVAELGRPKLRQVGGRSGCGSRH